MLLPLLLIKWLVFGLLFTVLGPILLVVGLVLFLIVGFSMLVPLMPFLIVGMLVWLLMRANRRPVVV